MSNKKDKKDNLSIFERLASSITRFVGSATAFSIALATIIIWAVTGPFFDFSQTWQIVINTATTIVTFLMVFLIQHSQNKDALSLHLKLNEVIKSLEQADNRLIDVEEASEEELDILKKYYEKKGFNFIKIEKGKKIIQNKPKE